MARGDTLPNVLIGAVVTFVVSMVLPLVGAVVGGGVAGYLQRTTTGDGAKVGALSGAVATLPVLGFAVVFLGVFALGEAAAVSLLVLVLVVGGFVVNVALGALGGYLGAYLALDADVGSGTPTP